jgi:amidase
MNFDEYRQHDGIGLAKLIASGEVTSEEVADAAMARANAVNPTINAVVHDRFDKARDESRTGLPAGPLCGVPYLIKDLAFYQEGEPATLGSRLFDGAIADHDSAYTTRCKAAGLNIIGRSNSPELGLSGNTEPLLHGPCSNPWNIEHSAGGSSGGAAAAVSAGILPFAHATDGGGSIRIPAAQCGLFGLKPSRGRISFAPDAGEGWGGLSMGHVVSRSVQDSALMLDITAGPEPGDPYTAPTPQTSFLDEVERDPGSLRIAVMYTTHRGTSFHAENTQAIREAAKLCESMGHHVEEADLGIDLGELRRHSGKVSQANICRVLDMRWEALGRSPSPDDVERVTWHTYERGRAMPAREYLDALAAVHSAGRKFANFMQRFDIILSATVTGPPPLLGELDMNGDPSTFVRRTGDYLAVTPLHNATGTPAMSVPMHWTEDGLPIGVHFAAGFAQEGTLIRLAAQIERAAPWFDRVPQL